MNRDNQRPVTLEDLLGLKRTERPPAEFWNQFDRELRAKQLSALVEKRPWWRRVPAAFAGFSRYQLPLGATAVLAITVLSVRGYHHASPAVASTEVVAANTVPATRESAPATASEVAVGRQEVAAPAAKDESASRADNLVLTAVATMPNHISQIIPSTAVETLAENSERDLTPTARFIATNLALAKATEPGVAQNLLGASRGFETRALPVRIHAVEPLAQMASPSDARRSRLLNGAVMSVSMNTVVPARTAEVRSRRLSDEQLYDTISRFGGSANTLLVKF